MKKKFRFVLYFVLICQFVIISRGEGKEALYRKELFPVDGLEKQVNFWKKIYTRYTTDQAVIHDTKDLDIIYEVIDFKKVFGDVKITEKMKRRLTKKIKKRYRNIVSGLAKEDPDNLKGDAKRVYELVKKDFRKAARNIRAQIGQRDRFEEGLRLSGLYADKMKEIFREFNLPEELTVLPHVESSFQFNAYSKFGAAGIWQFTRSTGRLFMRINYEVDERRDPILSSVAAAKFLKMNYKQLGNWPLAITAYNHGPAGMKRAKRQVGSDKIVDVINGYNSYIFGFASKNFYAEFLAALEIVKNYKRYFGDIDFKDPVQYDIFEIPDYITISTITKYFNISKEEIAFLNPALRRPVLSSQKLIPKGFKLHIPRGKGNKASRLYARIPQEEKHKNQKRTKWYRVRRGDTLIKIARRFDTSVASLESLNRIANSGYIFSGQLLHIPYEIKPGRHEVSGPKLISGVVKKDTGKDTVSSFLSSKKEEYGDHVDKKKGGIGWIEVEHDETLGHYADWLKLPTQTVRNLNRLRYGKHIKIGQKIKLSFAKITPEEFEEKRSEYHQGIEEDFFSTYFVENTIISTVGAGQTVWNLCRKIYEIPYWLLKKYNQDKNLLKLAMGESLVIPIASTFSGER
ncbi:MAG: transglycosylase SLT domain-containing protein [Nitrospinota bacterium]